MKKIKMITIVLAFICVIPIYSKAQSALPSIRNIETLEDLKTAIDTSSFQTVLQGMHSWFPKIVTATNWQNLFSPHYMLHYYIDVHDEDDILFSSFAEQSETIYTQLNKFFKMEANTKQEILSQQTRLLCFIIKTRTKITFGFLIDPHTFFFYLDTKQTPEYLEKFRHEYAHWVWGRSYGEAPSLFSEGVATYAEKMSNPESNISIFPDKNLELENIPPLQEIAINDNFWKRKGMYTAGSLFIYFLVEKWGWDKLKSLFLMSSFEDTKINEHFQQVYGMSLETVDVEWRQFLRTKLIKKD